MSKVSKTLDEIELRRRAKAKAETLFARPVMFPDGRMPHGTVWRDPVDDLALALMQRNAARVEHDVNDKVCRAIAAGAVMSPGLHHQKSPEARSLHQPVKRHFTYRVKRYPPWSSK